MPPQVGLVFFGKTVLKDAFNNREKSVLCNMIARLITEIG